MNGNIRGITFGLNNEIVFLGKYAKGWNTLDIPKEYKTKENFEHYCYGRYMCLDMEQVFIEFVRKK